MIEFNIDLGIKELYTLKDFNFDIINNGSADLQIDDITTSSANIQLSYIKVPFIIMKDTTYSLFGHLKILNNGESYHSDYIDLLVSWTDSSSISHSDTYRYYLNYESTFNNAYTQTITITNVTYINNIFILYIDADTFINIAPSIVLLSIDGEELYIFPKMYKITDKKLLYTYSDINLKNTVVDTSVKLLISSQVPTIELHKLSWRSM